MPSRTDTSVNHRFVSYRSSPTTQSRVGLVDNAEKEVAEVIGYSDLFQIIEAHPDLAADHVFKTGPPIPLSTVEILAPLTGRDVLCIGKNYIAHAAEFHKSGYDNSDKNEQPDFPVLFTKRHTSIVATGHPIYTHPNVTQSLDYEGELGIILGRPGLSVSKEDAWGHVWGAVVLNDVTARERQRDHKQFYVGKSLDTFCPMGPYVIPSSSLDFTKLHLTTTVNGEVRQSQNTSELIFDIPTLIATASMGVSIQPGDIIATGTPVGVGMGMNPKVWLQDGDTVEVSIPPLGTLRNPVSSKPLSPVQPGRKALPQGNVPDIDRVTLNGKPIHAEVSGPESAPAILFIHGLGGSLNFYHPAISALGLDKTHRLVLFDLEGHGRSPLSSSELSIAGFAADAKALLDHLGLKKAHVVGHSMGGLVATTFAATYPDVVDNLLLVGATKSFAEAGKQALTGRAKTVRESGLDPVAAQILVGGLAELTKSSKPLVKSYVKLSITTSPPEGYALACLGLAAASEPDYSKISAGKTVILAGKEDKTSPAATTEFLHEQIKGSEIIWLENVGHWHGVEDVEGTANALKSIL
ncbi:putative hydrolase [Athelia psychrophila]|uniref:Hydrolase n=1 Tax=Athelia psychrophila TaxID=1759441 RepID=A0A166LBQ5_9AGAM|nr:putative hydrolase [Fibularhizoctonia sp. CBS 109695]